MTQSPPQGPRSKHCHMGIRFQHGNRGRVDMSSTVSCSLHSVRLVSPQQGGWAEESEAYRGLCLCCHQGEVEWLFTDLTETLQPRDVRFWDTFVLFALRAERVSPPHWLEVLGARTQTLTPEPQGRATFRNCLTPGITSCPFSWHQGHCCAKDSILEPGCLRL